jgi:hypothetical protein
VVEEVGKLAFGGLTERVGVALEDGTMFPVTKHELAGWHRGREWETAVEVVAHRQALRNRVAVAVVVRGVLAPIPAVRLKEGAEVRAFPTPLLERRLLTLLEAMEVTATSTRVREGMTRLLWALVEMAEKGSVGAQQRVEMAVRVLSSSATN